MRSFILSCLLVALFGLVVVDARKNWALLVAGSSGYSNYRHQADICHAYQIVHKAGIPEEQIVVMMFDDIAYNRRNPFKGNVINKPNGTNVYPGVKKDYTGHEVTSQVFLAVLQGQKEEVHRLIGRHGKVVDSGPDDYVFVYFADHGAPGVLCMPQQLDNIKARDLNNALLSMHQKKRYNKLAFYVEACESGSMFEDLLPTNLSIYVVTAANSHESSFECYYDKKRKTYLGDTFSISWLEDTDASDPHKETLQEQYERVRNRTTKSHVSQWGDLSIANMMLDKFIGNNKQIWRASTLTPAPPPSHQIPSEMVSMETLKRSIEDEPVGSELRQELEKELDDLKQTMTRTHKLFWDIATATYRGVPKRRVYDLAMKRHEKIVQWECYESAFDALLEMCPGIDINNNDFALRKFHVLVNLCNHQSLGHIVEALEIATRANPMCHH